MATRKRMRLEDVGRTDGPVQRFGSNGQPIVCANRRVCSSCGVSFEKRYHRKHVKEERCKKLVSDESESSGDDLDDSVGEIGCPEPAVTSDVGEMETVVIDLEEMIQDFEFSSDSRISDSDDEDDTTTTTSLDDSYESNDAEKMNAILITVSLFIGLWQSIFNISDNAISMLLCFLATFLKDLAVAIDSDPLKNFADQFPRSIYKLGKLLQLKQDAFTKYVVCVKCYHLYMFDDSWHIVNGMKVSKRCKHVEFSAHPQRQHRRPCGEFLLKEEIVNGVRKLLPRKTYCYKSVLSQIQRFVKRPFYEEECRQWRHRTAHPGILTDVYDGAMWKKFVDNGFLQEDMCYCLMLNLDWFQPFDRVQYSVGVIYAVNQNLPRTSRFKRENIFLIGLIPDMKKEPPVNTSLQPLVDELKEAWKNGFLMRTYESPDNDVLVKLALTCVGCDVPATRKLCGFLGHAATLGCSRCLKKFPGVFGSVNYGGFDRDIWPERKDEDHRLRCYEIGKMKTKTTRDQKEREYGVCYSVLLELDYYSPIRMATIDPMHNLFQGTGKLCMNVWRTTERNGKTIVTENKFDDMQRLVDSFVVPSDVGKIPHKIESNFSNFTADQIKKWILFYSIPVLKDTKFIPKIDLECWRKFTLACHLLCGNVVNRTALDLADQLLISFCKKFEELYGTERVTPNMHLHGHLMECILDYGPLSSFWLFSFERFNGMMGSIPTNKRNIEEQLFRRFDRDFQILDLKIPEQCANYEIATYLNTDCRSMLNYRAGVDESPGSQELSELYPTVSMAMLDNPVVGTDWSRNVHLYHISSSELHQLTTDEFRYLESLYAILYAGEDLTVATSGRKMKTLKFGGDIFGSWRSRSSRSSFVRAYWPDDEDGSNINIRPDVFTPEWPGRVNYYLSHSISVNGKLMNHLLANVSWFLKLTDEKRFSYGKPFEVWADDLFLPQGTSTFIPVQRILCKYLFMPVKRDNGTTVANVIASRHNIGC